jgi:GrpB-like predicted nucleotidyltransferase (UPF0157 family)
MGGAVATKKTWSTRGRGKRVILHGVPIGVAHGSVELVPYDDRWPALFASEAALLHTGLEGQMGRIAHIGSTAIRGMDAKPIIDLMVEVPSLRAPNLLHWSLARFGYALVPKDDVPDRLFFVKLMQRHPTHHLSVCEAQSNFWYAHLSFRDRLRADSSLAKEYAALKWQLSREHRNDRAAYTRAKEAFISAVLAR